MSTMNPDSLDLPLAGRSPAAAAPRGARRILAMLAHVRHGSLALQLPDGQVHHFGSGQPAAHLVLHSWQPLDAVMRSGDIGFAESYIAGEWSTDNLPGLIEFFVRNRNAAEKLIYGSWWGSLLYRLRHLMHRNTRAGSRKNIHAHYDIGNDFYRLWLDPSMTYSSALYTDATMTLEEAQDAKYHRILRELDLAPGARVLEIGCGWGGFAEMAARERGAHVTGLTLSTEQLEWARARLANAGLGEQADLRLQDYRDEHGQYDAIASIEMFEAVGEAYWPTYFECIARNLKKGGRACVQTIVIDDALFARYRRGTDFIQQYIFPGGMLPSPAMFRRHAEAAGLRVVEQHDFGLDYARTLAEWRRAFHACLPQVRDQGFDTRFIRTWDFYLAYCEGGFRAGSIDVAQFTLQHA